MKVEKAKYVTVDGRPLLDMVIDGKQARVGEVRQYVWSKGYVPLDSTDPHVFWEDLLPPVVLENGDKLRGCTNDPVVIELVSRYIDQLNSGKPFQEGALPIPKA